MSFTEGTEVKIAGSKWKLKKKLDQKGPQAYWQQRVGPVAEVQEERFVFVCRKRFISLGTRDAVIKIRKLTPTSGHEASTDVFERVKNQVDEDLGSKELKALHDLTRSECKYTPELIATEKDIRGNLAIWYILMQKVPGEPLGPGPGQNVEAGLFWRMNRTERDDVRTAFKRAWLECVKCSLQNYDAGLQNLIWDKERKKCWIVDWEVPIEVLTDTEWDNKEYFKWGLVRGDPAETWQW